jgi:quercetin dioxygenase-like cupin family protein
MAIAVTTAADPHCHDGETVIQAVDGIVYLVAGDEELVLTPGDTATIEPGLDYRRWNAGDDDAHWLETRCES